MFSGLVYLTLWASLSVFFLSVAPKNPSSTLSFTEVNWPYWLPAWDYLDRRLIGFVHNGLYGSRSPLLLPCTLFSSSILPCICLLLPFRTYCFSVWQSLGMTKGWRPVEGEILWASVARLAANHLYEHAGGQREAHYFSLASIEEMNEAHPVNTNQQPVIHFYSDVDPRCRYLEWAK